MISAGNDIVALNAIDRERTVQPRFFSKILSVSEQELYSRMGFSGLPFENFVWLLWSIKESAYKYYRRIGPDLVFSPPRIVVKQLERMSGSKNADVFFDGNACQGSFYQGIVHSGSGILYSRSTIEAGYISTVVSSEEQFDKVRWDVATIDQADHAGQSASARALLLDRLQSLLPADDPVSQAMYSMPLEDLRIEKCPRGCPLVYKGEKELGIPVSLAHHGHFVAYSFHWDGPETGGIRVSGSSRGSA